MRRPKPHQIVLAIGVLAAVGTVASGIAPQITHWHDESPVSREVFVNIPAAIQVAFYITVAAMLFATKDRKGSLPSLTLTVVCTYRQQFSDK